MHSSQPVYVMSVASLLSGLHPQTLRHYDKLGLVSPQRVGGRNRLYSQADIQQLLLIVELSNKGVNLAGIEIILYLQKEIEKLKTEK